MRTKARVDANQGPIVAALRQCGWTLVDLTRVGKGCPDWIAAKPGKVRLVEIKTPNGKLTPQQIAFFALVDVAILRSVDDALRLK